MACRTLHPDPSRLLSLGEAATAAGVSHLALRREVSSGRLVTLPALHLGQEIRLVEPAALLALHPALDLSGRAPLDPEARGLEWIGAQPDDRPPQGVYEPARLPATAAGPPSRGGEATPDTGDPAPVEEVDEAPVRASLLDSLVEAEFGGSGRRSDQPAEPGLVQPDEAGQLVVPTVEARPTRGTVAVEDPHTGDTAESEGGFLDDRPSRSGPPSLDAPELPSDTGGTSSPNTALTDSVERWETSRRRRRRIVQAALVVWAAVLGTAWVQFEFGDPDEVLASWRGLVSEGVRSEASSTLRGIDEAPPASAGSTLEVPGSAIGASADSSRGEAGSESSPVTLVDPSSVVAAESGPSPSEPEPSGAQDGGLPRAVAGSSPVALRAAEAQSAADAVEVTYSAHELTPRFAGAPCAWWPMTRPGGDLRAVLGPCKGPYDESHAAIVGLHRHGQDHLCTHHLRFVRDLGGDLQAELASAAAARAGGLAPPLVSMRVEGAARSMVRERVGRWIQSGFETGRDHQLVPLGPDSWRLRTWVLAAREDAAPARMAVELELTLGNGPFEDTLQSFLISEEQGPQGG